MERTPIRLALAALAVGAVALTGLPAETTTAAFTSSATASGGATTTAVLPPLTRVQAERDRAGAAILRWDANVVAGDNVRYRVERTVAGHTTVVDAGDGMVDRDSAAPPIGHYFAHTTQLSTGSNHTCAVASGDVYCWGWGLTTEFPAEYTPTRVGGVLSHLTVSKVAVGNHFACAIAEGEAYCWGQGSSGQLGNGAFRISLLPVKVGGLLAGKTVTDITAGARHACAIADARAYCWGAATSGNLGNGTPLQNSASPVAVGGLLVDAEVTDISAGGATCAIAAGRGYCWGSNAKGGIGDGTLEDKHLPAAVSTVHTGSRVFTEIVAGGGHNCAVAGGNVYCWGAKDSGQLGDGTTGYEPVPHPQPVDMTALAGRTVSSLMLGAAASCVLVSGDAFCWGRNDGAFGDPEPTIVAVPTRVAAMPSPINAMALGRTHGCSVWISWVYCWGQGRFVGTGNDTPQPVAVMIPTDDPWETPVCRSGWRAQREPDRCGVPLGTEFPGFIDDLRIPGPDCAPGWVAAAAGMCAPGSTVSVRYDVFYEVGGWSSPSAPAVITWRVD